jgi:hypothetical protein
MQPNVGSTLVVDSPRHSKIKGSSLATAASVGTAKKKKARCNVSLIHRRHPYDTFEVLCVKFREDPLPLRCPIILFISGVCIIKLITAVIYIFP